MPSRHRSGLRKAAVPTLVVLAVGLVLALVLGRDHQQRHELHVTVADAAGLFKGLYVRSGGSRVGEITDVAPAKNGRVASVRIELDPKVWPLPRDSRFVVRWGGTITLFNRYLDLARGRSRDVFRNGDELPSEAFATSVEYGELLGVFDRRLRTSTRSMLDVAGASVGAAATPLRQALVRAPGAIEEADAVLEQLDGSRRTVRALVRTGGKVVDAIDRADPGVGELVTGAGTTLRAIADDVTALQATLERAPGTFRVATDTLGEADGVLTSVEKVATRIDPGVRELRGAAPPLNRVLRSVVGVTPTALSTLATVRERAPDITTFLRTAGRLAPAAASATKKADTALNCIRPYTPEIISLPSIWGSALSNSDGKDNYFRVTPTVSVPMPVNLSYSNSAELVKQHPGLTYAFPRPPGTQAGQPWLLPECGAGPDAFDPSKDPEARNFSLASQLAGQPATKVRGR